MKKILLPLILLIAGLAVGGGAAFATSLLVGPKQAKPAAAGHGAEDEGEPAFVPTGKVLAPLVFADGRLSGYVSFEIQLEVPADQSATVTAKLPLLLHAINMRTYRAPMASGPDGMLPNLDAFRKLVEEASVEAFGPHVVRHAAITSAVPA